jgi:hypothetical protein
MTKLKLYGKGKSLELKFRKVQLYKEISKGIFKAARSKGRGSTKNFEGNFLWAAFPKGKLSGIPKGVLKNRRPDPKRDGHHDSERGKIYTIKVKFPKGKLSGIPKGVPQKR